MSSHNFFVSFVLGFFGALGYLSIFFLMFLESSFFPFPSEVVMIPAGYLAFQGRLNIWLCILFGVLGSVSGAWFNYFLADKFGRRVLLRFLKAHHLGYVEVFFEKHGHISTFNGRLIPVVRQYISFPAGLARMNPFKFTLYTAAGSSLWVSLLSFLGYFLGKNQELVSKYLREITFLLVLFVVVLTIFYLYFKGFFKRGRFKFKKSKRVKT